MKNILLVVFVAFVAGSLAFPTEDPPEDEFMKQWNKFKVDYNKSYQDEDEEQRRMDIFEEKLIGIDQHNKKYEEGLRVFKMSINEFSDRSDDEWILMGKHIDPTLSIEDAAEKELMNQWEKFKSEFKKHYSDGMEENQRLSIFRKNLIEINEQNESYNEKLQPFKMSINEFCDRGEGEIIMVEN